MDNIRTTLQLLFCERKSEDIIKSLKAIKPDEKPDLYVEKEWFNCQFREKANIYSLDQITSIYRILTAKWMTPLSEQPMYSDAKKSVFNALLHFGNETLIEKNGAPICRYENLMRWHHLASKLGEDLLTTSFLASKDLATRYRRNQFTWKSTIDHDNRAVNYLFEKRMADLHFHLKGSSLNFDLNWLSLMNSIKNRKKEFGELKHYQSPDVRTSAGEQGDSLYLNVIKACAIRYLLFQKLEGKLNSDEEKTLSNTLSYGSDSECLIDIPELESKLSALKIVCGKKYGTDVVDYAIPCELTMHEENEPDLYRLSILAGERKLMYQMFQKIYQGDKEFERYATLFYAYLAAKSRLRHELIQLNEKIGFGNFANYEQRKELFIKEGSVYEALITHLAVRGFLKDKKSEEKNEDYLEVRITPKMKASFLARSIRKTDSQVLDRRFNRLDNELPNFFYILHFIKKEDKGRGDVQDLLARHYKLRQEVKIQAIAIYSLRAQKHLLSPRIAGIDAANSEIFCRPEVFAHAYRYLKYTPENSNLNYLADIPSDELGFTYHVGEDYLDLVDGLRAVDEAILFLNLSHGDRLGHALVLGSDSYRYYSTENNTLVMPKQVFLDNVVWLWTKIQEYKIQAGLTLLFQLEKWFEQYFREIFGKEGEKTFSIQTYYQSWLLRGDNPEWYDAKGKFVTKDATRWAMYGLNNKEVVKQARENKDACKLFYRYHYDKVVKETGEMSDQYRIDESYIKTVDQLQKAMLKYIENCHLCIETNPTSNYVIGTFDKYSTHPITKFYNQELDVDHPGSQIAVSINTDDQGVFCTSIEREFSLVALALEKEYKADPNTVNTPRGIYKWLDDIREMAFEQRFRQ